MTMYCILRLMEWYLVLKKDDCVIGIAPDTEDSGWTFGQVFLRAYYTIFDRDENRIGFVRSNTGINPQPGHKPAKKASDEGNTNVKTEEKKESKKEEKVEIKNEEKKPEKKAEEKSPSTSFSKLPDVQTSSPEQPNKSKSIIGIVADTSIGPSVQIEGFNAPKIENSPLIQKDNASNSNDKKTVNVKDQNISPSGTPHYEEDLTFTPKLNDLFSESKEVEDPLNNNGESNYFNDSSFHSQIIKTQNNDENFLRDYDFNEDLNSLGDKTSEGLSEYSRRRRRRRRRFRRRF